MRTQRRTPVPAGAAAGAPRRRGTSPARRRQHRAAYLLVAPFMLVFAAMLVVPLGYAAYLSLFREQLIGGTSFVGLDNYVRALTDSAFLEGVGRVALFLVVQVPIMLGAALLFALLLDSGLLYLERFVRLAIFLPYAVPSVVATLMWGYLYGPDFGPFAQIAEALSLPTPRFLSSDWMLGSIMNVLTWEFVGYNMIIMFAALRAVPADLYEAARVDGAGEARIAWSVKIPAIRGALLLTAIFSVIGSFQLFNEPQLLSILAPSVIDSAYTPNLYAYNLAFTNQNINYSAAVAFLLALVIAVVSYVVQLSSQRRERNS
ncbi:sugar ABC transporter permease [Paenibacillus sp. TRM 82003]|uniref:carbohydrate ABC transporter permease n=1 Tax=Kineococcus sp. TRM81007 TaxID=2925831 RepID=UPI001F571B66|nr:sugar ABC transporter permease [Kineococcus sp. TRM81007]MCI2236935.1 sugar ABC transporter permease [Kineococcus sp. TRM81007]MCI3921927.1 sugar ABC transporter permease [Paenibacillus sp. TRM 82003]